MSLNTLREMIFFYYLLSSSVSLLTGHFIFGWITVYSIAICLFKAFDFPLDEAAACISGSLLSVELRDKAPLHVLIVLTIDLVVYSLIRLVVYDSTDFLLIVTFAMGAYKYTF